MSQPIGALSSSKSYILTFYSRSYGQGRLAQVAVSQNYSPYIELISLVQFETSTTWQKYQLEFTPTSSDSDTRLIFYLAGDSVSIYFDDIHVFEAQETRFDSQPYFSAIYHDPDSGDYADNYQIQVIKYDGDWNDPLWDSTKTALTTSVLEGDRSEDIAYDGDTLPQDGMKYLWRIKFWDDEDNGGAWSNGEDFFIMNGKRLQDLSYEYDDVGNIMRIVDESETNTRKNANYVYDDLYRLTSATITNAANGEDYTQTYTYDSLGNITNKSDMGDYEYNGNDGTNYANPHAVTNLPDTYNAGLNYDNNGNLTSIMIGSWALFSGAYDYNNRLISDNSGAEYEYDHEGNRISKVVNEIATIYPNKYYVASGCNVEENIYANNQLVMTATNDGETMNLYYVHDDHLTSSSVMTKSDASVEQVVDYYPFGSLRFNQQSDPGNSYSQRQKFTQKELDSDASGLYYFGARYYSGDVGRFTSEDPLYLFIGDNNFKNVAGYDQIFYLSEPQNLNSYSYVTNNPLKYVDPLGLDKYINTKGEVVKDTGSGDKTYYEQDDINTLNQNAAHMEQNRLDLAKFYEKVKSGGDWDYKTQEREFFFNGTLYGSEDFGNINYGYCGTAGGFSKGLLKDMAGLVSIKTTKNYSDLNNYGIINNFDQPSDVKNINFGIKTYMSSHNNDSTFTAKVQQLTYYITLQPLFFRTAGMEYMSFRGLLDLFKK